MDIKRVTRLPHRLFLSLLHHRIYGRQRWRIIERDGIKYKTQWGTFGRAIAYYGGWENEHFDYLTKQIKEIECEIFLDVGAHFGSYALRIAVKNLCAEIYAIEGSERTFSMLQENFALNNSECKVKLINSIVSDDMRTDLFYEAADTTYNGISSMEKSNLLGRPVLKRKIKTTTLDDLFSFYGRKIAIKIDVEGHELRVLKGAKKLLSENEVLLQIEIAGSNISHLDYLKQNGFRVLNRIGSHDFFLCNF